MNPREVQYFLTDEEFKHFGTAMEKIHKLPYLERATQLYILSSFLFQDPNQALRMYSAALTTTMAEHFKGDREKLRIVIEGIMTVINDSEKEGE